MSTTNAYDAVAYPGFAYAQTHPDRLATIATLFGMTPAPPERCRVLDIGCGDGRNLIAMATALPESTFVGFDLAGLPVASGRETAARLGLRNLTLTHADLMSVTAEFGTFDYILAHGFYAWVPPPVQDRLLSICRELLAPQGVAYVSYNAYPGAHLREMFREILQFHARGTGDPPARTAAARAGLDFVRRNLTGAQDVGPWILSEMERLGRQEGGALFHDLLAEVYRPATFAGFMEHAGRHGLQYLGEADFFEMSDEALPPEAAETLRAFSPDRIVDREQLLDFLKMRSFRQTLLCRDGVPLRRDPASEDLGRFHVSTRAHAVSPAPESVPPGAVEYRTPKGAGMVTESPELQALMARLEEAWPGSVPFPELAGGIGVAASAAEMIVRLYGMAIIDLHPSPPRFVRRAGPAPAVSELTRLQIERSPLVTNLLHADVRVEGAPAKELILHLDGRRTRPMLLEELAAAGVRLSADDLEQALGRLARLALLTK